MISVALGRRGAGRGGGVRGMRGGRDPEIPGAGMLGLVVFLVSLSVLFAGCMIAFLVVRHRAAEWPPAGAPAVPGLMWLSTALLVGTSGTAHAALRAIRRGDQRRLVRRLAGTAALALLFLACQSLAWLEFYDPATFRGHLYGFTFFMLTGLHAAHVIGGLAALGVVLVLARRGAYSWARFGGVRNVAIYWHFLDGVWLVLFGFLLAAG